MINSAIIDGLEAIPVVIEAKRTTTGGLDIVGITSEAALREIRVRVRASTYSVKPIEHVQLTLKRLDGQPLPKAFRSSGLDLAFALAAMEVVVPREKNLVFFGELSLGGQVRSAVGAFPVAELAQKRGGAAVLSGDTGNGLPGYLPVWTLAQAVATAQDPATGLLTRDEAEEAYKVKGDAPMDLSDFVGQPEAVRAVTVAAVAGLGVTLVGPPGSGRTMLARRLTEILPETTPAERRQIRRIASVAGLPLTGVRPFRAPHHTASQAAVVGGGAPWRPGEVTLALHGVLMLDEVTESPKAVLAALREHQRKIGAGRPWIVAAMNPCPSSSSACGLAVRQCTCTPMQLERHRDRVKDFRAELAPVLVRMRAGATREASAPTPSSATVRAMVTEARALMPRLPNPRTPEEQERVLALAVAALEGETNPTEAHRVEARGYLRPL